MIKYDDTVSSQTTGQPIYGAQVTVLNAQGLQATIYSDEAGTIPLSQPILTDQSGYFSFYIDDGRYNVVVMAGQAEIARTNITMVDTLGIKQRALLVPVNEDGGTIAPADARKGMVLAFDAATGAPSAVQPNAFAGPPGGSDSAFLTLADLKGSDPIKQPLPRLRTGGTVVNYAYVAGDFTGRADDVNVVKLDAVPLATGALVRQTAASVSYDARSVQEKIAETPSVADTRFAGGAKGDVTTNNVDALTAALQPANAGYKTIPAGIYSSATVTQTLAPGAPHHLDGDGPGVSVIRKLANDAAIALDLAGTPQNLDNHTVISNLSFDNGFRGLNGTGLRLTNTAREVFQNVVFDGLSAGFYARGALLLTNIAVTFRNCNKGYTQERGPGFSSGGSTAYVYPNMNKFIGGTALGCPGTGFDINHASGFGLIGTNVEGCGTSGDLNTGGLIIRPTIAAETGFGTMEISGHFERNAGFGGITGGPLTGLILHIRDSDFIANEAARDIDVSGAWSIGLTSNQGNGVTKISARMSYVWGGLYNTLIDTSPDFVHHTETADGKRVMWMSEFRLCHDPAAPLNADLQFLRGDQVTGSAADRDTSYVFKRGAAPVRFSAGSAVKIAYSTVGVGFNGNNPIAPATIANPTDAASTQAAVVALLNHLRNRGDLMP